MLQLRRWSFKIDAMGSSEHFLWTQHSRVKMRQYRLTESRVKRIIRHPARVEEGILEGAIACMQPAEGKKYSEIWVMYVPLKSKVKSLKLKVISAWRYPGRAPERDPVPQEVLRELKSAIVPLLELNSA